jgi:streptogramin lyase
MNVSLSKVGRLAAAFTLLAVGCTWGCAGAGPAAPVEVDGASIGGTVLNGTRPEAGVWVIAETSSLPTHFSRIVVTDDNGQFLIPDLPEGASYDVWVRGYGLRDSQPSKTERGQQVTLQVQNARTPQEAAKIYPANYWLSLYQPPPAEELPLVDSEGVATPARADADEQDEESSEAARAYPGREHWVGQVKLGCMLCHQMGQEITRLWTKPEHWDAVWERAGMVRTAESLGKRVLRNSLADWGTRIAAGEVPPAPPRPSGVERNAVITQWGWAREDSYIHDNVSTDKRNPTLYGYGKVWGIDIGQSFLWALDPVKHTVASYEVPRRDGPGRDPDRIGRIQGSTSSHNPMLDDKGNVWLTTSVRSFQNTPAWARDVTIDTASGPGSGGQTLDERGLRSSRQLGYWSTSEQRFVLIDTAFATHHLQFDSQGRLWTSGDNTRLGMFDPSKFDPNRPLETENQAQTAWAQIDPATGKSAMGGGYGIIISPVDGTVWRANYPGIFGQAPLPDLSGNYIDKFDPKTRTYKRYPIPLPGYGPRGIDATTDGKLWFATGSGHLGRFDPSTEKFTYWETPGPKLKSTGKETGSADFHYYIWVDQFNTLGLGKDMVIVNGTNSDSLLVFDAASEKFTVIRTPYPVGMFTRGLDGRIDDANAGWKGRGLWVSNNTDGLLHTEKRRGFISHVQFRGSPLAR